MKYLITAHPINKQLQQKLGEDEMNIYSEKSIAGALQRNTCPLCGNHYMAGEVQGKKHYIGCNICQ